MLDWKKYTLSFTYIFLLFLGISLKSLGIASKSTNPAVINGLCGNDGIYTTITGITVSENISNDFASIGIRTFILTAPSGFAFKPSVGTVTNLITSDVSGTPSISISKTSVTVTINILNTLFTGDYFVINDLEITSITPWASGNIVSSGTLVINGIPAGTSFCALSSVGAGNVSGLSSKYCPNSGLIDIEAFPSTGSFSIIPSIPGFLTNGTTPGTAILNTSLSGVTTISSQSFRLSYTYPSFNGCSVVVRDLTINPLPNVSFSTSEGSVVYPRNGSFTSSTLTGVPSGGTFFGTGVTGNFFYADLTTGTLPGTSIVSYAYKIPASGCADTSSQVFTIYDPLAAFVFTPTPPLVSFGSGSNNFCIDDYTAYSMALNTLAGFLTPELYFNPITNANYCIRSPSITAENVPSFTTSGDFGYGITATGLGFGNYQNFKFIPSNSTVASINLNYNWDYISAGDANCAGARIIPMLWSNSKGGQQKVNIYDKPSKLHFDNDVFDPDQQSFCNGKVLDNTITFNNADVSGLLYWYRYNGTVTSQILTTTGISPGTNIYSLEGSQGTLLNALNTITGLIKFSVRQRVNGCWGDTTGFTINIKPLPTVPGIVFSNTKFCKDTTYNVSLSPTSTVVGYTYKWFKSIPVLPTDIAFSRQTIIADVVLSTTGYYLTTELNNCNSNELFSSVSGSNITVVTSQAFFNNIPSTPTIIGINPNTNVANGNKFCIGSPTQNLRLDLSDPLPIGFRWFRDISCTIPVTFSGISVDSTGVTTISGLLHKNFFDAHLNTNIPTTGAGINFYVKSVYTVTGCKSKQPVNVNVIIDNNPPSQIIQSSLGDTLNDKPFCFNYGSMAIISLAGINEGQSNTVFEWYKNSTITSDLITTLTGSTFNTSITGNTFSYNNFFVIRKDDICRSQPKKITVVVNPPVTPPIITSPSFYCTGQTVSPISASSAVPGAQIQWFVNLTSSGISSNSINPEVDDITLDINVAKTTTYYASVTDYIGCVSTLASVNLVIRQTPGIPETFDKAFCNNTSFSGIRAQDTYQSNQLFIWKFGNTTITDIGLQISTKAISTLNTSLTGTDFLKDTSIIYRVLQQVNGCYSAENSLSLFVYAIPDPPIVVNNYRVCAGKTLPIISAGSSYSNPAFRWYYSSSSISGINTLNSAAYIPSTLPGWSGVPGNPTSYNFFVNQTTNRRSDLLFGGCTSTLAGVKINIYPLPVAPGVIQPASYCSGDQINALVASGVSSNVIFTWYNSSTLGPNYTKGNFNPFNVYIPNIVSQRSDSIFYVTQKYNYGFNDFSCEGFPAVVTITVNQLPIVDFVGLNDSYCSYQSPVTLTGSYMGGIFSSSITGFINLGGGLAYLNPQIAIPKVTPPYEVTYDYTEPSTGCSNSVIKSVRIYPLPTEFDFIGLNTLAGHCAYLNSKVVLQPQVVINNVSGIGTFTIMSLTSTSGANGIIGNEFNPGIAGAGDYSIAYSYTISGSNCVFNTSKPVTVHPVASIDFSLSGFCEDTPINYLSTITGVPTSSLTYKWDFGRGDTAATSDAIRTYKSGSYTSNFSVLTQFGCISQKTVKFSIGPYPIPNFTWNDICLGSNTRFNDSTDVTALGQVKRYWDFGDPSTTRDTASSKTASYKYNVQGAFSVKLTVQSDKKCISDTSFVIHTLPVITQFPYLENFNSSNGGWFAEGNNSDWLWGMPDKKYIRPSQTNNGFWVTGSQTSIYLRNQDSWVNSPCFVFAKNTKPMISLKMLNNTSKDVDGSALQYSRDNGRTWLDIGQLASGLGWYNSVNILGKPGKHGKTGLAAGWSGDDNKSWQTVKHVLNDKLAFVNSEDTVRFRLAFGSNSAQITGYDGFAFDSVWVGERTKVALIEHFTNIDPDGDNYIVERPLNDLINRNNENAVSIQYHTSFPKQDIYNTQNAADPSARILYYGIKTTPTSVFEGINSGYSLVRETQQPYLTQKDIDLATLEYPAFEILLNKNITMNNLSITSLVHANYPVSDDTAYVLHIAVVQRVDSLSINERHESILKAMLPNAGGTILKQNWNTGDQKLVSHSWNISNIPDNNKIGIVAFIQNQTTKKVLQAAYIGDSVKYELPTHTLNTNLIPISVFPNPASNHIEIGLDKISNISVRVSVVDSYGKLALQSVISKGSSSSYLNVENLEPGVYFIKLERGLETISFKKLVIIR